jgi:DNA polymerase-3 subunit epsilon
MTQETMTSPDSIPTVEELLQAIPAEYLERVAQLLERYPTRFRVLRAFDAAELMLRPDQVPEDAGRAIVADTEATGKDAFNDRICELGMVEIAYDRMTGYIYGVTRVFDQLEDPGIPMPEEASAVNHITDDMLVGKVIDDAVVVEMVERADFIICHNSDFDRPLLERRFPIFEGKAFACSFKQVPWGEAGITSAKQDYIAAMMGFFYLAHRADSDCLALVKILNTPLAGLGNETAFQRLLENYTAVERRIWAVDSPFAVKDVLSKRGYRWSDGLSKPGTEKAWFRAVPEADYEAELAWLFEHGYLKKKFAIPVDHVDAHSRFSPRRDRLPMLYYGPGGIDPRSLAPRAEKALSPPEVHSV